MSLNKDGQNRMDGFLHAAADMDSGRPEVQFYKRHYSGLFSGPRSSRDTNAEAQGIAVVGFIFIALTAIGYVVTFIMQHWVPFALAGTAILLAATIFLIGFKLPNYRTTAFLLLAVFLLSGALLIGGIAVYQVYFAPKPYPSIASFLRTGFLADSKDAAAFSVVTAIYVAIICLISLMPSVRRNLTPGKAVLVANAVLFSLPAAMFAVIGIVLAFRICSAGTVSVHKIDVPRNRVGGRMLKARLLMASLLANLILIIPETSVAQQPDAVAACHNGTSGTREHFVACFSAGVRDVIPKKGRSGFPMLGTDWDCIAVFETYAQRLKPGSRVKVDCRWLAELVSEQLPEAPPAWVKCTNYRPDDPTHVAKCLVATAADRTPANLNPAGECRWWGDIYKTMVARNNEGIAVPDDDPQDGKTPGLIFPASRTAYVHPLCAVFQAAADKIARASWRGSAMLAGSIGLLACGVLVFGLGPLRDKRRVQDLVREKIQLEHSPATIAGSSNWSETHVKGSSSGGGGYVGALGGHVRAPSVDVSSKVASKHQFFLVYDNGQEVPITLTDIEFATRSGQTADTVWLSSGTQNEIVLVYVRELKRRLIYHDRIKAAAACIWPSGILSNAFVFLAMLSGALLVSFPAGDWIAIKLAYAFAAACALIFLRNRLRTRWARQQIEMPVMQLLKQFQAAPAQNQSGEQDLRQGARFIGG